MHTYIHTYIHTQVHTYKYTGTHAHTDIGTYRYRHTLHYQVPYFKYMHAYIHAYIQSTAYVEHVYILSTYNGPTNFLWQFQSVLGHLVGIMSLWRSMQSSACGRCVERLGRLASSTWWEGAAFTIENDGC